MEHTSISSGSVTSLDSSEAASKTPKVLDFIEKYRYSTGQSPYGDEGFQPVRRRYFHSRRVAPGDVRGPRRTNKDPKAIWLTVIPLTAIVIGLGIVGFLVWHGVRSIPRHKYCSVYESDFSHGLEAVWQKEVEVGGYGNGQFEETTSTDENVFVKDGMLWIKPTLQDVRLVTTNNVINLTATGTCTSDQLSHCVVATNTTNGTIVNPVKSGRINTRRGAFIRYGRIEVEAKLPAGDWLWPAIWMLPVNSTYGPWPASGEIDIMESRGNNHTYAMGGNNMFASTLHWGPDLYTDAYSKTTAQKSALHSSFASKFHIFGLEWSENYLYTYVDGRVRKVLHTPFNPGTSLWSKGHFPLANASNIAYTNPWATNRASTPFDQNFYLILNVAVGGHNGWFQDKLANKPWRNGSPYERKDFWDARDQWLPTWENGSPQLIVKSVKMWQQSGYNGCIV